MDLESLKRDLKAGHVAPIYLLHGEERYFIEAAEALLEETIMPGEAAFDKFIAYGNEVTRMGLLDQLHGLPFIEPRRLVMLREAQLMDGEEFYKLESYVGRPAPSSVFVIAFKGKKVDKRRKFVDALRKAGGFILESDKLGDKEILPWLEQAAKGLGLRLAQGAPEAMVELIGKEVSLLYPELVKLAGAFGRDKTVAVPDILDLVGMSREYNAFELKNAIEGGDRAKAMKIGTRMAEQKGYSIIPVIALLIGYYANLYTVRSLGKASAEEVGEAIGNKNAFIVRRTMEQATRYTPDRLERCLAWLHEYDMKSKGWENPGRDDKSLTIELLDKLLYA
jgi:DNA polymerase-3 subunit delta